MPVIRQGVSSSRKGSWYTVPAQTILAQSLYCSERRDARRKHRRDHWNARFSGGKSVCVHAFIGKLADGSIATYQTLPWDYRGRHAGGKANDSYIGFEICEDGLTDPAYFYAVYKEAVELCVYLCKQYGLTEKNIICHSEGHKLGIASNHADVMHWFPKHGKSMDTFRADVKADLFKQEDENMTRIHSIN